MKHIIFALLLAAAPVSQAEELTISFYYPPGGGTDTVSSALIPALNRSGVTVKKEYFKSCAEAIKSVAANPTNHILSTAAYELIFSDQSTGGVCPPLATLPVKLEPTGGTAKATWWMCTNPGYEGVDLNKLAALSAAGKKIRLGYPANPQLENLLRRFAALHPELSLVLLPYTGIVSMRMALTANDIDLVFFASPVVEYKERGSSCIVSSARIPGTPFIGDLKNKNNPDFYLIFMHLGSKDHLAPELRSKIINAYNDKAIIDAVKKLSISVIESDSSPAEIMSNQSNVELFFK